MPGDSTKPETAPAQLPLNGSAEKAPPAVGAAAAAASAGAARPCATTTTGAGADVPVQKATEASGEEGLGGGSCSLREVSLDAQRRVAAFLAEDAETELLRAVQRQVRVALEVIDKALEDYGPPQLSLSYNGGKDCLVMLILILASLPRHFSETGASSSPAAAAAVSIATASSDTGASRPDPSEATPPPPTTTNPGSAPPPPPQPSNPPHQRPDGRPQQPRQQQQQQPPFPSRLQAVYVVSRHPFAEVDAFVDRTASQYRLSIERIAQPMKPALHAYLAARPAVRAVFVGTRRTDPHGESLTHFDPTDPGWPPFMRVHPVIDWHYAEIWAFIRHLGVPYCELYDRGYTSLGGTTDTSPNPALKRGGSEGGHETFRPAYELMEDFEERLGRDR